MEKLLDKVKPIAEENGMDAYIIGSKDFYDDGRLLKICPRGVRARVLLEIEVRASSFRIYKHRTFKLTNQYKGRVINTEWVIGFIKHNKSIAAEIIASYNENAGKPKPIPKPVPMHLSDEEVQNIKAERHTVSCSCLGEVESCVFCYGKGSYVTDGFGKKI